MTRRPLVFVALLGLALFGAACRPRPRPVALVRAAPARTRAARTAHLVLVVEMDGGRGGSAMNLSGDGAIDFARRRSWFTIDLAPLGLGLVEERVVGSTTYVRLADPSFPPSHWVTVSPVSLGPPADVDPADVIEYLQRATSARRLGRDEVTGADTSHYAVTVLLGAGVARQLGVTNLGLDVWLDHRGRVVRLAYDVDVGRLPLQAAEAAVAGKVRTTLSFDRFGVGVTVDPPPPGQVTSG